MRCKICNSEAEIYPRVADREDILCPYCGKYSIIGGFDINSCFKDKTNFYKLSSWIKEQNDEFNRTPMIDFSKFEQILNIRDKKIKEKFDLMMHYISSLHKYETLNEMILVKCWLKNTDELSILLEKARNEDFIEGSFTKYIGEYVYPLIKNLTFKGIEYIEQLEEPNKNSKNIFVAFNFSSDMINIFENYVKPSVEELGFTYTIVNQETTAPDQKITDEIIAKIKSSRMIIADFTNNSTNVYFEAGFAMGMKIPVIWTCKKGHDFSFDTGQFPHIMWEDGEDLRKQLINRIQVII